MTDNIQNVLFASPGYPDRIDSEAIDFEGGNCVDDPPSFPDAGTLYSASVGAFVGGEILVCEEACFIYHPFNRTWIPADPLMERRNYPR